MTNDSPTETTAPRRLSWRDVNGLAFVMLVLGITVAFATLTEANYRAIDAKVAAAEAEKKRQNSLAKAIAGETYSAMPTKVAKCDYGLSQKRDVSS